MQTHESSGERVAKGYINAPHSFCLHMVSERGIPGRHLDHTVNSLTAPLQHLRSGKDSY